MNDFILPDIGEGIVECELLKWLVKEGDVIKEDQPVAEVMTDKATVEIPAMHNGVVAKLYYQEGDIAKVHAPLFAMQDDNPSSAVTTEQVSTPTNSSEHTQVNSQAQNVESFVLPDIGEGIVECEILIWHVAEGDVVEEDQVVVEVMTDKAVVEIPAKHQGKILKLHYQKGDIAKVHSPLFDQVIDDEGVTASDTQEASKPDATADRSAIANNRAPSPHIDSNKQGEHFEAPIDVKRPIASPAVRRLAREHGINLDAISATGKKGRVLKQDVFNSLAKATNTATNQQLSSKPSANAQNEQVNQTDSAQTNSVKSQSNASDRVEAIKGIKAAMAKQMVASVSTIPHFTVSDELCMDQLISLRQTLKPEFEKLGVKLSFMPFFIKALSLAMQDFPIINSRLNQDATELTYVGSHNIGLAVDSKIGLLVPNIKNVQGLSLLDIARELNRIIEAAREGKLSNADLKDGTVSLSNIGALGGITATPVINKPEVAIVALGKTQQLPRFDENGEVNASNIMMVNWSGDHRVIDGATMVKFNNLWLDYLSQPQKMLVHLR